jgi:hypothetical protein
LNASAVFYNTGLLFLPLLSALKKEKTSVFWSRQFLWQYLHLFFKC